MGVLPTLIVARTEPVEALSSLTALSTISTQTWVPSKEMPRGELPKPLQLRSSMWRRGPATGTATERSHHPMTRW
jgi:hypothetical protein